MGNRACLILSVCMACAAGTANAQRLDYEDVLVAQHAVGPRLSHQPVETPAAPLASATDVDEGPVRAAYFDRIEYRGQPGGDGWSWDLSGEIGSQAHRLWLATAGDASLRGGLQYVEAQALYSHPVLDTGLAIQAGVRRDFVRPRRTYAVLGVQGNVTAPLYLSAFGFLSTQGEVSGRAYAYYDWEPARRLVLQPYAGVEASAQDVAALALGRGFSSAELGLRVRYRIAEPFAPYVGLSWDRLLGRTARFARDAGDGVETTSVVIGLRSYF